MTNDTATDHSAELREALQDVLKGIDYCHRELLMEYQPARPLTSRWPVVYAKGRAALATGTAPALIAALQEALEDIEYFNDLLAEEERTHPRGSGWARVYDKGKAAIALVEGA
jgi:hypothetical protein